MAYQSLYRKYRPLSFDEMVGQNHITTMLKNQILSGNISHAYIFTGSRGTGKTTAAKIFARAVNCLNTKNGSPCLRCENCLKLSIDNNLDIIEIDAASNNGVNEIREVIDNVKYPPTIARYKVYIIDEVHMLSISAFNALLKTLEEPPHYVIFILATTEVHKLPETIISRCLRFDFRLVAEEVLINHLAKVLEKVKIEYDIQALKLIAQAGQGSVRDALSICDMCISFANYKKLDFNIVYEVLGLTNFDNLFEITKCIVENNVKSLMVNTDELMKNGANVGQFVSQLAEFMRELLYFNYNAETSTFAVEQIEKLTILKNNCDNTKLLRAIEILLNLEGGLRYSTKPRILLECALIKACDVKTEINAENIAVRLNEVEKRLAGGGAQQVAVAQSEPKVDGGKAGGANKLWLNVVKMIENQNHPMLYDVIKDITFANVVDNEFNIVAKTEFDAKLICKKENLDLITETLNRDRLDNKLIVKVSFKKEENNFDINSMFKQTLKNKNGGSL